MWWSLWRIFSCFLIPKKFEKSEHFLCLQKKVESFHKYCPTAFSPAICAKFVFEWKVQNSAWKISNVAIFHNSVALNINFYRVKSSRDAKICRKIKFQGVWTELRIEICFLRQFFTKYFETDLWNRVTWDFYGKFNSWFCSVF